MSTLSPPAFFDADPAAITRELVALYEDLTGKTLYPAQPERIWVDIAAYRESLAMQRGNDVALQMLVRFSRAPLLDFLGEMMDTPRLGAVSARAVLRFAFPAPLVAPLTIPAGAAAGNSVGSVVFAVQADVRAGIGAAFIDVSAVATSTGTGGNGWEVGQISVLMAPVDGVVGVSNISASSGGADAEGDDAYRLRVLQAPEKFSVAGPVGAYRFWARSADPSIIDVAVLRHTPEPGDVSVIPLVAGGVPSSAVLAAVEAILSAEDIRPTNDHVVVRAPTLVDYSVRAGLEVYGAADRDSVLAAAKAAAEAWRDARAGRLGGDIVRKQIEVALMVAGVYDLALAEPAESLMLGEADWPRCTEIDLRIVRVVDG
jgi:phage-related baseplate assembly protein